MKSNNSFFFITMILLAAYMLSACGGGPVSSPGTDGAVKVDASMIAYTGIVESIDGDQWVVNGQSLRIDPTVVSDGPFQVGDTVKIEGFVNPDGSLTVSRVEAPSASDLQELPQFGNENANANSNDVNSNDDNSNDGNVNTNDNSNTDNNNGNGNDNANANDSGDDDQEVYGVVEAITEDSITIDGVTYNFTDFTEIDGVISMGDQVKIEFVVNADGTLTVYEIEKEDNDDDNSNFNSNSNDDDDDDDDNSNNNSNNNDDDDDDNNSNNNSNDDDDNNSNDNSNDD